MAFIDEVTIHAKAGRGGSGVVRWRKEKFIDRGGPSGGDGGRGGSVYVHAVRSVHALAQYQAKRSFEAGNGEDGAKQGKTGHDGADIDLPFPVGSIITNKTNGEVIRLDTEGERVCVLKGGVGGLGNEHFKSSTNVAPKEWTPGKAGEEADLSIELELIADVGLIGFPNAGKTSLLNALSAAHAKTGDYPFTTLEPNLGECFGYIIADIPGLISGAAEGKGLGDKFLRHIRRTKVLVHLISLENDDVLAAYRTIRDELGAYDKTLLEKPEIVLLTKSDLVGETEREQALAVIKTVIESPFVISVLDDDAVKRFRESLISLLQSKGPLSK